ncbi:GNAT family N-acetyltransferase [Streptomyces camponoticapitis]|uniref:GNAT family N-acetyltransferase n=1 Tax=Streptomyces camponoticapitis TaxID=1616125 RepID=UPI001E350268|nr:GNAT family N-acetyltransferase [Streptomyces camponoticapitis]
MTPDLRTERLTLSPYVRADEDDFVALFQDTRVSRWMGDGPRSEAADRALFGRVFTDVYPADRFAVWAVRHDGRYAGHAEIKPSPEPWLDGHELVYALTPAVQGLGLGRELAAALTAYGHDTLGLAEVHATVDARNAPSLSLLAGLGYTRVRDMPQEDGGTTSHLTHRRR